MWRSRNRRHEVPWTRAVEMDANKKVPEEKISSYLNHSCNGGCH